MKKINNLPPEASKSNPIPKSDSKHAGTLVKIVAYNESKHLVKVVRANDGEPLEPDATLIGDIKHVQPYEKTSAKVLKTGDTSDDPIIEVNDSSASVRGSADHGFYSYNEFGNIIKGPLSISAAPHEVRLSGITTLNPLLTSCFPSTIVTPLPVAVWSLPGAGLIAPIAKDVAVMAGLISALGVG